MNHWSFISVALALFLGPLLPGIIGKVKAKAFGRKGPPFAQAYRDVWKLLHKGAAISETTTWIFVAGPAISLGAILVVAAMLPFCRLPALVSFPGDFVLVAVLFGLSRFFTMIAALDTGSSFEGMGASREAWFSSFAEVAFLLSLFALAYEAGSFSLTTIAGQMTGAFWMQSGIVLVLIMAAVFIVMLTENSRMPVDDPATHLELTMIHEVMVLDHGGPDLAFITYGQSVKLWCFCSIIAGILPLGTGDVWVSAVIRVGEIFLVAIAIGVVESLMARLKLLRIPQLLVGASALALFALALSSWMRVN